MRIVPEYPGLRDIRLRIIGGLLYIKYVKKTTNFITINPLLHEFSFLSILEREPKIDSYRLPTHRRGTHLNFFIIYSYF